MCIWQMMSKFSWKEIMNNEDALICVNEIMRLLKMVQITKHIWAGNTLRDVFSTRKNDGQSYLWQENNRIITRYNGKQNL